MKLVTQAVGYCDGETNLMGYLAFDDRRIDSRPGILLVHGGAGLDDHAKQQALRYAALGYIVFACDMYGDGVAGDRDRVVETMTTLRRSPGAMLQRGLAGLTTLADCPRFNGQAAAIGFCFGGMAVLEFARAGMDVAGVVSIHGSLATSQHRAPGSVKPRILVCHGGRDPHVPFDQVSSFVDEMNHARVDCELIIYANALHGFTHKRGPTLDESGGTAYDRSADRRSFLAVQTFLNEVFMLDEFVRLSSNEPLGRKRTHERIVG